MSIFLQAERKNIPLASELVWNTSTTPLFGEIGMVSSKAGLLVQRPNRDLLLNRLNCAPTSLIILSVCSQLKEISPENSVKVALYNGRGSNRTLEEACRFHEKSIFRLASDIAYHNRHQSESARSHCSIGKDCVWVNECFSNSTTAKWSKIQVCQKKTKKFQLRARCRTTWEQDAVQTTRRPWKGQNLAKTSYHNFGSANAHCTL